MAEVGAQPEHRVIDRRSSVAPELNAADHHRVAQVLDARVGMVPACLPPQPRAHAVEDVLDRTDWQGATHARDEERSLCTGISVPVSYLAVVRQGPHDARVQR